MRFNLLAIFWCMAGVGFAVEHLIGMFQSGGSPAWYRLIWIVVFVTVWAGLGQFWIRMRT
ncbi:MAG TPA: hypothetical protein DCY79_14910 [Planctomycetaceae bacterium]|nr:hypothetical protein [Blastopirellula sp.]HAY81093.1 hypothetical protein [Planctomycetaceae bacterium]